MDRYVPLPNREIDQPFLMPVEGVYAIKGRGTVATGRIETGRIRKGQAVAVVGMTPTYTTVVTDIEQNHRMLDEAIAGDNAGLLLRGVNADQVVRGQQFLPRPDTMEPHTQFVAELYVLSKEERRPPHAVLQRLPAAVLFPDRQRSGDCHAAGRHRDDHAGRCAECGSDAVGGHGDAGSVAGCRA